MPLLFAYGTLRDPAVQRATFGRVLDGQPDGLVGFERRQISPGSGTTPYENASFTGNAEQRLEGIAFDVEEAELAAVDLYERQADYIRMRATLASGREAWVYVHAGR